MDKITEVRTKFIDLAKDHMASLYKAKFAGQEYEASLKALVVQHEFDNEMLEEKLVELKNKLIENAEAAAAKIASKPTVGVAMVRAEEKAPTKEVAEESDDEEEEEKVIKLSTEEEITAVEAEIKHVNAEKVKDENAALVIKSQLESLEYDISAASQDLKDN